MLVTADLEASRKPDEIAKAFLQFHPSLTIQVMLGAIGIWKKSTRVLKIEEIEGNNLSRDQIKAERRGLGRCLLIWGGLSYIVDILLIAYPGAIQGYLPGSLTMMVVGNLRNVISPWIVGALILPSIIVYLFIWSKRFRNLVHRYANLNQAQLSWKEEALLFLISFPICGFTANMKKSLVSKQMLVDKPEEEVKGTEPTYVYPIYEDVDFDLDN